MRRVYKKINIIKKDKNAEYDLSDNLCPCLHIGRHTFLYNAAQYDAAIITGVVAYSATLLFCVYDNTETNLTAFLNLCLTTGRCCAIIII